MSLAQEQKGLGNSAHGSDSSLPTILKYLFIEANQMDGIRPVWITKNPRVVREVRELGYEAYLFSERNGDSLSAQGEICGDVQWNQ